MKRSKVQPSLLVGTWELQFPDTPFVPVEVAVVGVGGGVEENMNRDEREKSLKRK